MCSILYATMKKASFIIAQFRWIALIVGLFAFYLCVTISSSSSTERTQETDDSAEVMHEVQGQHVLSLLDEVPNSTEFSSLDMMLAGRSNDIAQKPSRVIKPAAGTPPEFELPRVEQSPINLRY